MEPVYPNSGRFEFASGLAVHRCCWLVEDDPTIAPSLRTRCHKLPTIDTLTTTAAAYLGTRLPTPMYLIPHTHWEHELLDHCPQVWRRALDIVGQPTNDPQLTAANGVVIDPGAHDLAMLLTVLLNGLDRADAMILVDAPVMIKIHHHGQLWFSATDPAWLPDHV